MDGQFRGTYIVSRVVCSQFVFGLSHNGRLTTTPYVMPVNHENRYVMNGMRKNSNFVQNGVHFKFILVQLKMGIVQEGVPRRDNVVHIIAFVSVAEDESCQKESASGQFSCLRFQLSY